MSLAASIIAKLDLSTEAKAFAISVDSIDDANVKLTTGLSKVMAINEQWAKSYEKVIDQSLQLELRNAGLNKSFGISSKAAAKLSQTYTQVADKFKISSEQIMKYGANLKKIAPLLNQNSAANSNYVKSLLSVQKVLTTNLGLSEQVAEEYTYYATQKGQDASQTLMATKKLVDEIDPQGDLGLFKQAAESLAKAGADVQLQFGQIPGRLELAALKANSLGLELSQLKNTGKQLLNIESSVGDELEYQLLTGRRLVTNQGESLTNSYRMAMVQGDMNKQADILNRILTTEGDTLTDNMFAREQMAKLLGMEEGALSRAIQKRKLLEKLKREGGVDLFEKSGEALINQARAAFERGAMTEQDFQKLMDLEDTRTTDQLIKEQLKVAQEQLYYTILSTRQLSLIEQTAGMTLANAKRLNFLEVGSDDRLQKLAQLINTNERATTLSQPTLTDNTADAQYKALGNEINTGGVADDALVVNDGLIRFNPKDKFMSVNDGAFIAGTNVDGNKKLAASINGANAAMTTAQVNQLIQAFHQSSQLITNAINSQTTALKPNNLFGAGLNASTWG